MQRKPREKAWISLDSFGRIGTFQWVTANPNKKSFLQKIQPYRSVQSSAAEARQILQLEIDITYFLFINKMSCTTLGGSSAVIDSRPGKSRELITAKARPGINALTFIVTPPEALFRWFRGQISVVHIYSSPTARLSA
jgi:hypothetical protein